jgi:histidinol dehydrogenase
MASKYLKAAQKSTEQDRQKLRQAVEAIIDRVREQGDEALKYYEKKFDNYTPPSFRVSPEELAQAENELPPLVIEELDFAMEQVGRFAKAQRDCLQDFETEMYAGMRMGHRVLAVNSCGCYVPGGRYPCLSAAVMSVMPAKVAGVERIVVCSPPGAGGRINPGIQYTLHKMGVAEVYCLGGAQAVAALAYGTQTMKPVHLIVGPGNQFVAEAKRQVFGDCGIDFLAGPSEVQIIADESASPDILAADLLAQCEHDPNARGSLVTVSEDIARRTMEEIEAQLKVLTTEEVARASWEHNGEVVVCPSLADCAAYANDYAPEHLEIHTTAPRELLPLLHSYGSLFLGEDTAEVYADKIAGTNHSLPTSQAAKYTGGLWVGNYLKVITHQMASRDASLMLARYAEAQSTHEGMDAHRNAAAIRLRKWGTG